jgi:hypothetical protein
MAKKVEVIVAKGDNSDYQHGELYETAFSHGDFESIIFTKKRWKGKVKITIEEIKKEATK